ncbi:hypothetical protein DPMN_005906 [Dreissena polymorpha]|uniref:Uncharacterized protein n=1 Tax=Dreissena polymorpha TaxID=45954 RepID=A0A9D4MT46_DREPO|nr:hypothetical protein DPMN_005906 [Dreissena polymorpha]
MSGLHPQGGALNCFISPMVLLFSGEHEHCYRVDMAMATVGPQEPQSRTTLPLPPTHRSSPLISCPIASLNNTGLLEYLSMLSFHKLFSTTVISVLIDLHSSLSSLLSSSAEE